MTTEDAYTSFTEPKPTEGDAPAFKFEASPNLYDWLRAQDCSLAFTTYQGSKCFFVGRLPGEAKLSIYERTIRRCMGFAQKNGVMYVSSLFQLHRFKNILAEGELYEDEYDALFVPQVSYTTGSIDIHDIGFLADGRPIFVNTRYNCLATLADGYSFEPLWKPPFIAGIVGEDRCHLNGMAMQNGKPAYVTAVAETDHKDGWRSGRVGGGVVIDVASGEIVGRGLSMPHSPRLHDGKLWLHNSGTGEFGFLDRKTGRFEAVLFLPGFLRGLSFSGRYAIMGLSKNRHGKIFGELPISERIASGNLEPKCGIMIVNLESGRVEATIELEGLVRELYDVAALPGLKNPALIGFVTGEVQEIIKVKETEL